MTIDSSMIQFKDRANADSSVYPISIQKAIVDKPDGDDLTTYITEYNISLHQRNTTAGVGTPRRDTSIFTLSEAIAQVPEEYKHGGLKLTFNSDMLGVNGVRSYVLDSSVWNGNVKSWYEEGNNGLVGYYTCTTGGGTAAKTVNDASGYVLSLGGSMKIRFTNRNTASNPTLNINGQGAKTIVYDGSVCSSTNTWADGETVEVYYDGTNFQANNVAGGGNFATGQKVREIGIDNEPVAGSGNLVKSGGIIPTNTSVFGIYSLSNQVGWPNSNGQMLISPSYTGKHKVFKVNGGDTLTIVGTGYIMILASYEYNRTTSYIPDYATGETTRRDVTNSSIVLPNDANFIVVASINNAGVNVLPDCIYLNDADISNSLQLSVKNNSDKTLALGSVAESNRFYNKKLSIIGDSISTFDRAGFKIDGYRMYYPYGNITRVEQTWWHKIVELYNMSLEVNASWSGSCVTNIRQSNNYPDFYDRTASNLLGNPDVIFVALGTNDSTTNVETGAMDFDKNISELDESKFCEAYIKGIKALQTNYPNAEIVCLTFAMKYPIHRAAVKEIAEHYNLLYLEIPTYDQSTMTAGHPSTEGMNTIANKVLYEGLYSANREIEDKVNIDTLDISKDNVEFEQGGLSNGSEVDRTDRIRTDYILAAEILKAEVSRMYVLQSWYYDKDKNYLSYDRQHYSIEKSQFPTNTAFIRFVVAKNSNNYKSPIESSSEINVSEGTNFTLIRRSSVEKIKDYVNNNVDNINNDINGINNNIDNINNSLTNNIVGNCETKQGYVKPDGSWYSTVSWTSYVIHADDMKFLRVKLWNSLNTSTYHINAISFFSDDDASVFISGLEFSTVITGTYYDVQIPSNVKSIICSNRNNDGVPEIYINAIEYLNSKVSALEPLAKNYNIEYYDSLGNAEFWLSGSTQIFSDMTWVGNKLIGITSSSDDLTTETGNLYVCVYNDGVKGQRSAVYILKHYWGHCNTIDYNADNDCLILGNGSGDYNLLGKIFIIPNFSSIVNVSESSNTPMSLSDVNALIIDCTSYNLGSKFNVLWGDDNDKNYNIAYLITANIGGSTSANGHDLETIRKIVLRKDSEVGEYGSVIVNSTPFNGTFDIVETSYQTTAGYPDCDQGTCYYKGEVIAAVGHGNLRCWKMHMHDGVIFRKDYKQIAYHAEVDTNFGNSSGVCVKDGYLFIGRYGMGIMAIQA